MQRNRTVRYFTAFVRNLPHLTSKEKIVLIRRLKTETLERIGKKFGVTEGRVRQIERQAIKKTKSKVYQQRLFKNNN